MAKITDEMVNSKVEDFIHNTKSRIDEMQINSCPMEREIYMHHQFKYWYDGYEYRIYEPNVQCYAVSELPYCYPSYKQCIFRGNFEDLVNKEIIWPTLFFVDGYVIPWSKIEVIKDYNYTYLIVKDTFDIFGEDYTTNVIYFPVTTNRIRYGEDEDILLGDNVKGLYFDADGRILLNPDYQELSVRLEFINDTDDIYFKITDYNKVPDENSQKFIIDFNNLPYGYTPTINNIILFDSTTRTIKSKDGLKIADCWESGIYGKMRLTETLNNNIVLQMYFMNDNLSKSSIYHRMEDLDKESVLESANYFAGNPSNLVGYVTEAFDFEMKKDVDYLKNVSDAVKYITQYDFSLWNDLFIENSPIKIYTYSGKDFKKLADAKSFVKMSRKHSDLIEDVCMMFVNSKLYKHSIDISYMNNIINIPAFGILDEDDVEIIIFTKCNNNVLDVVIPDENTPVYIHPEYNLDDCYIMDDECTEKIYKNTPISPDGRRQYICETLTVSVDKSSNYLVKFKLPEYYGKRLKLVPKNQFRYYKYQNVEGQHKIILPTQFNYCHDIDRYMIFVNGIRIDRNEFTVTIMNPNRPFENLVLYISTILDKEDYVDVFYVPELLVEKYSKDSLDMKGTLRLSVDKDGTNYPKLYSLSKNTCMVFVNGLLINPRRIKDVSMTRLLVDTGLNEVHNVRVVEYLDGSEIVARYLYGMQGVIHVKGKTDDAVVHDTSAIVGETEDTKEVTSIGIKDLDFSKYLYDRWEYTMSIIEDGKYKNDISGKDRLEILYGTIKSINTANEDYKKDYAPLRSILYDIIVDYYLGRNSAPTGDPFVYDFEVEQWESDGDYNRLITLFNKQDKLLDYYTEDRQARDEDVLKDKKYIPL